ncbi:peptidoglycan recognition protein [Streptomyces sp. NPDC056053]|uniref:peptidoglycan recognition protein family protein n=1 Tax=Streptomyces sp. NPDC056053 TaxID=3345696 RepID=UPI0035D644FC
MRAFLASSIGVTCAAVLALPSAAPAGAAAPDTRTVPAAPAGSAASTDLPGSTQSLPMRPLPVVSGRAAESSGQGLTEREVRPFSLVGVVWDDVDTELHGTVQVRTRAAGTDRWSDWQDLETHNAEHAADPGSAERGSGAVRGATAPLWVGDSDGVAVRVVPDPPDPQDRTGHVVSLPGGLRLELVDPGEDPRPLPVRDEETGAGDIGEPDAGEAEGTGEAAGAQAVTDGQAMTGAQLLADIRAEAGAQVLAGMQAATAATATLPATETGAATEAGAGTGTEAGTRTETGAGTGTAAGTDGRTTALEPNVLPALSRAETEAQAGTESKTAAGARPYIGPRPRIITRKGWGADEKLRERAFAYTKTVKAAFVHHSATGNNYTCSQAPSVLRGIYRYHVKSSGWRDFGYNFAVDKCGNIYEGRAGGVTKPVLGAHTLGFNSNSMGIAVLGTFTKSNPPAAAVTAVSKLTAWKLGLFGANPKGKVTLVSGGGNKYKKGKKVRLNVISGHRDGFATECPGARLYKKLGSARTSSARLQGR